MSTQPVPPFSPSTVPGKLVIAGLGLWMLDFIVFAIAMALSVESLFTQPAADAHFPPGVVALNLTVFMTGAAGFCFVVSGLMVWFIHEVGGVHREPAE